MRRRFDKSRDRCREAQPRTLDSCERALPSPTWEPSQNLRVGGTQSTPASRTPTATCWLRPRQHPERRAGRARSRSSQRSAATCWLRPRQHPELRAGRARSQNSQRSAAACWLRRRKPSELHAVPGEPALCRPAPAMCSGAKAGSTACCAGLSRIREKRQLIRVDIRRAEAATQPVQPLD